MKLRMNKTQTALAWSSWYIYAGIKTETAAQLNAINIIFIKGMSRNDLLNTLTA